MFARICQLFCNAHTHPLSCFTSVLHQNLESPESNSSGPFRPFSPFLQYFWSFTELYSIKWCNTTHNDTQCLSSRTLVLAVSSATLINMHKTVRMRAVRSGKENVNPIFQEPLLVFTSTGNPSQKSHLQISNILQWLECEMKFLNSSV